MNLSAITIFLIIIVTLDSNAQINRVKTHGYYGGRIDKFKVN